MKKIIFISFIIIQTIKTYGQDSSKVYTIVDSMPSFVYGQEQLYRFIGTNIIYPSEAKMNNIQGKVFISFVVDTLGQTKDFKILKDIGEGCAQEAINVIILTDGMWLSGQHNGKKVDVRMTFPVSFKCLTCGEEKDERIKTTVLYEASYSADYYYNLGVVELQENRLLTSVFYFSKAISLDNKHVDALYNNGVAKYKINDIEGACEDWEKARGLGDEDAVSLIEKYCGD